MNVKTSTTNSLTKSKKEKPRRSNEDKGRAVAAYVATGSFGKAASITGVHENTLRHWSKQDWWDEECRRAKQADADELASTATAIAKRAFLELQDRLENGDVVLDKEGNPRNKPIGARDAAIIAAVAIDKRKVLLDTPNTVSVQNSTEKLANLMEQFVKFATAKEIKHDGRPEIVVDESDSDAPEGPTGPDLD